MSKYCGKCGTENIDQDSFCVKCGYKLGDHDALDAFKSDMSSKNSSSLKDETSKNKPLLQTTESKKGSSSQNIQNIKNIGKICGVITAIISIVFVFLWKFDITVTESISGITTSHQQMSFIDLMAIQPGSVLGLIVVLIFVVAILSIINPMIGAINSVLCIFGFLSLTGTGIVKHGTILTYNYHINMGSDVGPMISYMAVMVILAVVFFVLYLIPRSMYLKEDPEYKTKESLLIFWK